MVDYKIIISLYKYINLIFYVYPNSLIQYINIVYYV